VWLLDVIAPNQRLATSVLANFRQVAKGRQVLIHPIVARQVDREALEKLGARRADAPSDAPLGSPGAPSSETQN
jgi:cytolysin-activating lysine-acyltransferase